MSIGRRWVRPIVQVPRIGETAGRFFHGRLHCEVGLRVCQPRGPRGLSGPRSRRHAQCICQAHPPTSSSISNSVLAVLAALTALWVRAVLEAEAAWADPIWGCVEHVSAKHSRTFRLLKGNPQSFFPTPASNFKSEVAKDPHDWPNHGHLYIYDLWEFLILSVCLWVMCIFAMSLAGASSPRAAARRSRVRNAKQGKESRFSCSRLWAECPSDGIQMDSIGTAFDTRHH